MESRELFRSLRLIQSGVEGLHNNMEELSSIHKSLTGFNSSFRHLLSALEVQRSCYSYPVVPKQEYVRPPSPVRPINTNGAVEQTQRHEGSVRQVVEKPKRKVRDPPSSRKVKPSSKEDKTSKMLVLKGIDPARIPQKYRNPQELERLEMLLRFVRLKESADLSDIVKNCGFSVMQCNEGLAALMKLGHLTRKKEKKGFVYCTRSSVPKRGSAKKG